MNILVVALATVVGLAAVIVVYCAFVANELVQASRSGPVAVGIGVFTLVLSNWRFLLAAAISFAAAFYEVVH